MLAFLGNIPARSEWAGSLQDRLKVLCQVDPATGSRAMPARFNGKPAMLGTAATLFEGPGYLEVDRDQMSETLSCYYWVLQQADKRGHE